MMTDDPGSLAERQAEGRRRLRELADARAQQQRADADAEVARTDARAYRRQRLSVAAGQVLVQALGTVLGGGILALLALASGIIKTAPREQTAYAVVLLIFGVVMWVFWVVSNRQTAAADAKIRGQLDEWRYLAERGRVVDEYGLGQDPGDETPDRT